MPSEEQTEQKQNQSAEFQSELESILNAPLMPETIDTYADTALDQLITLSGNVTRQYHIKKEKIIPIDIKTEDKAFRHYGLGEVNGLLDYISQKSIEINRLDSVIERAATKKDIIVPPSVVAAMAIVSGSGSFERPLIIPRLKTLLFILENEFDINLDDGKQFMLSKGQMKDGMMRRESYYLVEVLSIGRTVLVCDEESNVTLVFDNTRLNEKGISANELTDMTKDELGQLIELDNQVGRRIVYSSKFVNNMVDALGKKTEDGELSDESPSYLIPKMPEGFVTIYRLSKNLGYADLTVRRAVNELADELGEVMIARSESTVGMALSESQQLKVQEYLEEKYTKIPNGYMTVPTYATSIGFSKDIVNRAIIDLDAELGEVRTFTLRGSKLTRGLDSDQRLKIKTYIEQNSRMMFEKAEDGVVSLKELSEMLHLSTDSIGKVISELGDKLGTIRKYRFGKAALGIGLDRDQQQRLIGYLQDNNYLAEPVPEGYMSHKSFADALALDYSAIIKAKEELGESLGKVKTYRFGSMRAVGLSPDQQSVIKKHLEETGVLVPLAPEEFKTIKTYANFIGISYTTVLRLVYDDAMKEAIGDLNEYRFDKATAVGLSLDQQQAVYEALQKRGLFSPEAPEGYLSVFGLASAMGADSGTITRAIDALQGSLGEINMYRFGSRLAKGISPEQQTMIKSKIRNNEK